MSCYLPNVPFNLVVQQNANWFSVGDSIQTTLHNNTKEAAAKSQMNDIEETLTQFIVLYLYGVTTAFWNLYP